MADFRRITPDDTGALIDVFVRALWDYLRRYGLLWPEDPAEPPVERLRLRYGPIFGHLSDTASEAWLAESSDGGVLGYARSIERDGHVELTEFFVDPSAQGGGIGRGLLERAFPLGWGRHRSVLALLDPRAVSLYLRFGVRAVDTTVDLAGPSSLVEIPAGLVATPLGVDEAAVRAVVAIDREVVGFERPPEIRFLLRDRPAWLLERGGRPIGYAFGDTVAGSGDGTAEEGMLGPVGVLDPADLAVAVDVVIADAARRGHPTVGFTVPLSQGDLIRHLMARGMRVEPFYILVLADEPAVDYARYLPTNPSFII